MKTNLIFCRVDEKTSLKETKVVPIDIPDLSGDDWFLECVSDTVTYTKPIIGHPIEKLTDENKDKKSSENLENSPIPEDSTCINNQAPESSKQILENLEYKLFLDQSETICGAWIYNKNMRKDTIFITKAEYDDFCKDVIAVKGIYGKRCLTTSDKAYPRWKKFMTQRWEDYNKGVIEIKNPKIKSKAKS